IALDGRIVGEQQTLDERVYFRLQLPPDTAGKLETLENLTIMNTDGKPIYLKSVADLRVRPGDADIKHYFGKRTVTVFAEIDRRKTDVAAINAEVAAFIEAQNWKARYPDLRFVFSGELVQQKEVLGNVGIAFAICLLSIFFVLVLLFNSFSQPMLIFLDLPFSVAGVIIGFGLQGIPLSFLALVGVIGLMGVLVNDSVVMVHELNRHKGQASGPMSTDRIAEAAKLRFRPIIITSITTSAALFPAAYGLAGSNELITPMVMAMAWGVLFGTFISLLLLPCLYAINEDLSGLGQRLWERLRRRGPVPGE
ncbi:MAG: efflux RND transporter permease subunit, partial [Geminicoccaceae bacterium]